NLHGLQYRRKLYRPRVASGAGGSGHAFEATQDCRTDLSHKTDVQRVRQSLGRMPVHDYLFTELCLQQVPKEISQFAYRIRLQPWLRQLTSRAQTGLEHDVFGPSAAA